MNRKRLRHLSEASMIAALYVLLTYLSSMIGLSSQPIQLRLGEALCILPIFTPAAIPGLMIGCLLSNLLTNALVWDVVFGSLATLLGAASTYLLKNVVFVRFLPPILFNSIILPPVIAYTTMPQQAITLPLLLLYTAEILISEILACGVLGYILYRILKKHQFILFNN